MFEIRAEHSFPAGHWLRDYDGPCAHPHGHNYTVEVAVEGERLNSAGLLMDFGDLKRALRAVAATLDHKMLNDIPPFDVRNPSAENIALHFYEQMLPQIPAGVRLAEVKVRETATAAATYRPGRA